jgi:hypothetical protein
VIAILAQACFPAIKTATSPMPARLTMLIECHGDAARDLGAGNKVGNCVGCADASSGAYGALAVLS